MDSFELVEGRIVLYCLADGEYRPAHVVKVWNSETANLQVFVDGTNDLRYGVPAEAADRGIVWKTSIQRGEPGQVGRWITPMELVSVRADQAPRPGGIAATPRPLT